MTAAESEEEDTGWKGETDGLVDTGTQEKTGIKREEIEQ